MWCSPLPSCSTDFNKWPRMHRIRGFAYLEREHGQIYSILDDFLYTPSESSCIMSFAKNEKDMIP